MKIEGLKNILVLLFLLFYNSLYASHLSGGDIQYRYIGDSTGIARHYKVILRVYRDVTGVGLPTTANVVVSSGCYANINVSMTLKPGSGLVSPTLFDCVTPGPGTKTLEIYAYIGYTILPGNCSTYRFWYDNCCRPPGITNISISNGFGNDGFFFDAKLDNASQGQNSSPIFVSEPVRAFCVGNPFNWKQSTIEEDGDSIVYSLINCRENPYPTQINIPFNPGYTATQPVTSTYFTLNPSTGLISFLPTQQEIDVLSVLVEEWRFDTTYVVWYQVGSASRDMMISVSPLCNSIATQGVKYDPSTYPILDSITGDPLIEASCGDTSLTLKFHIKLDCYSVNNADFRMTGPLGNPVMISSIDANCDINEETDSLTLHFPFGLLLNGRYYLYSKKGMDGNTLINKCGLPMMEFDTIVVVVKDCPPCPPPPPIDLEIEDTLYGPEPEEDPMAVIIPNVFTPNGDGVNDLFKIKNLMDWKSRELFIYNRWGEIVYYNVDYKNDWNGLRLADGVYSGVLNIQWNNKREEHNFNLTLIR